MQLRGKTFRFALNQQQEAGLLDAFSGQALRLPRGNWVRFCFAAFDGDPANAANLVTDISNFVSATLVMRKTDAKGALLYQQTIPYAGFDNPALTFDDWRAKISQHFSFLLTGEQTTWSLTGWDGNFYFVLGVDTASEGPITLQSGTGSVFEDGIGDGPDTVVENPLYSTTAEADARYAPKIDPGATRYKPGTGWQLWNPTTGKFHTLGLTGDEDNLQPTYSAGEA